MKRIFLFLSVFVMIFALCACDSNNEETLTEDIELSQGETSEKNEKEVLTGTWVLREGKTDLKTIIFYSDGTCLVDNDENGTWSIVDNTLKVLGPYGGQFWDHDNIIGEYTLSGDELIFTNPVVDGGKIKGQIIYHKDE